MRHKSNSCIRAALGLPAYAPAPRKPRLNRKMLAVLGKLWGAK